MIEVICTESEHRDDWEKFVDQSDSARIAHRFDWRYVIQAGLSHKPYYLMSHNQGEITGVLPLFLAKTWWGRSYLVSIPWLDYGGICSSDEESEEQLLAEATLMGKNLGVEFVEMRAMNASSCETSRRKDKVTFELDTSPGAETLWKEFDGKLRNQIRKAEKSELEVCFGKEELLDDFYKVFCRNMRDLGTPVWGRELFRTTLEQFDDSSEIVLVKRGDELIAGALLLRFKKTLYVPSASSYRWARPLCPNHALYWRIIERGCGSNIERFDFGRSSWDGPTFKFKKQWVPKPTQLEWEYVLLNRDSVPSINPSNSKFDRLISLWRKLPLPVANFLGPKVIKNFP